MGAVDIDAANGGAEGELERAVDPRVIGVWRWSAVMAFTPVVIAAAIFVISAAAARAPAAVALFAVWALLVAALVGYAWKYPAARYRQLRYRVDDVGITIRDGVFWRASSALPRMRIQHTDVSQGPLQRRYGVAELKLYTAGSRYTCIVLPGLEHGEALALRDELQRRAHEDAV
jgi:membrane protein YdbS with pleckstrin-like domain